MSAIYAEQFESNLHDKKAAGGTKHSWNAGGLRHVVKVLQGRPVAIELDTMTGYTQVNVTLLDVRPRYSGGEGLAVANPACAHPQNPQGITVFDVRKVGVIIPLVPGFGSDKYAAIDSERREHGIARELFRAEVGNLTGGAYEQDSGMYSVTASHRPSTLCDGRYQYRKFTLAEIQTASLCDTCLLERETQQHEKHCPVFRIKLDARVAAGQH